MKRVQLAYKVHSLVCIFKNICFVGMAFKFVVESNTEVFVLSDLFHLFTFDYNGLMLSALSSKVKNYLFGLFHVKLKKMGIGS